MCEFAIVERFGRRLEIDEKEKTIENYKSDIANFLRSIGKKINSANEQVILKAIDPFLVEDEFIEYRKKYTMSTYNRKVVSLRKFGIYLQDMGVTTLNCFKSLTMFKTKKVRAEKRERVHRDSFTAEEINNIIKYVIDECDKKTTSVYAKLKLLRTALLITSMCSTGMRISEISNIKMEELEPVFENDKKIGMMAKIANHKTLEFVGEKRAYFSNKTYILLEKYLEVREIISEKIKEGYEDYLIISSTYKKMDQKSSLNNIKAICKEVGIDKYIVNHSGRVTFRTLATDAGVPEVYIRMIGGWSTSVLEESYIYSREQDVKLCTYCGKLF